MHQFRHVRNQLFCEGVAVESLVNRFGMRLTILEFDALDSLLGLHTIVTLARRYTVDSGYEISLPALLDR